MTSIYVDTNVFVDLFDATRPFAQGSFDFVKQALKEGHVLHINSDTVSNAFYIISKTKRYTPDKTISIFEKNVLLFNIVAAEQHDIMQAISLCKDPATAFSDYEDTLQYVCAKKIGASAIVTNDRDFVSPDIPLKATC